MSTLARSDIASYRNERMKRLKGATVLKELELIFRVINLAEREWDIRLPENPASGKNVTRPKPQPGDARERRFLDGHSSTPQPLEPSHRRRPAASDRTSDASAVAKLSSRNSDRSDKAPWVVADWVVAWMQLPQTEEQAQMRACSYPHWFHP